MRLVRMIENNRSDSFENTESEEGKEKITGCF
jgi:hypothetical protein